MGSCIGNVFDDLQNVSNLISSGSRVEIENKQQNKYEDLSVVFYKIKGVSDLDKKLYSENTVTRLIDTLLSIMGTNWIKLGSRLKQAFLCEDNYEKSLINLDVRVRKQAITVTGELNTRIEIANNNKYFEIKFKTPDELFIDKETYLVDLTQEGIGVKPAGIDNNRWNTIQNRRIKRFNEHEEVEAKQMLALRDIVNTLNKLNIDYVVQGNILLHILLSNIIADTYRSTTDLDLLVLENADIEVIKGYYRDYNILIRTKEDEVSRTMNIIGTHDSLDKIDVSYIHHNLISQDEIREYTFGDFSFRGSSPIRILKDKLKVANSKDIFGRSKDFIDLYLIFKYFNIDIGVIEKLKKQVGFTDEFIVKKQKIISTMAKNDSIYIRDRNIEYVYTFVLRWLQNS